MKVAVPISSAQDFMFGGSGALHLSAPSSPKPFGNPFDDPFDYFYHHASAPTSPTRASAIYAEFSTTPTSSSPFPDQVWDKKHDDDTDVFDFAFDFSGQLEKGALFPGLAAADELFESGKIRSVNPKVVSSPSSPKSNELLRSKGEGFNPPTDIVTNERGRERAPCVPSIPSSRSRRGSRSLSPLRRGGIFQKIPNSSPSPSTTTSDVKSSGGSRRWRLRDLFLFRSASEGRAVGRGSKDPLRKYSLLSSSSEGEDPKKSSIRSTALMGRDQKTGGAVVSAHDIYYTAANRVASEEVKKKNPLLRHGLFGYLRFNPAIHRGFNGSSFTRGRS